MVANKEIERIEHSAVKLTVTVPQQDVKSEYDSLLTDYSRKIQIKGFRKGKVPPAILERKFGDGIREEASRNMMEKSLKEVFDDIEEKPLPYSVPELQDDSSLEVDKDFTFTVVYDVYPEIEVGEYQGVQIEGIQVKIGKADEERELNAIQEQNSVVMDKESGNVEKDNIVTVDFVELGEGDEPIEESRRQDFVFTVGTGYNIYKIDDDIIGMKKGEEKVIEKTYPEDFEIGEMAGSDPAHPGEGHQRQGEAASGAQRRARPGRKREIYIPGRSQERHPGAAGRDRTVTGEGPEREPSASEVSEGSKVDVPRSMVDMELEQTWRNFVSRFRTEENQVFVYSRPRGKARRTCTRNGGRMWRRT